MAGGASFFDKELLSRDDRIDIFTAGSREPRGIVRGVHDGNPSAHHGVARTTILRTKEMVAAGFGGTKPHGVVMARNHVHLHAEGWNEEVMDDEIGRASCRERV